MKKNIASILIICASVFFGAVIVKCKSYFGGISWNAVIISVCTPAISAVAIWVVNWIAKPKGQSPQPIDEKRQQVQILFLMYLLVVFYVAIRVFLAMSAK